MNPDRQTAHNTHPTTYRFGGQLVSARAEDEPTIHGWFSRSIGHTIGSVRRVVRASSPGLWYCSEAGTDRPWRVSSAASNHPPRTPKARGARPRRSSPWQPTSWGGKTTYKTTHKTEGVYRPGQGAGTPPDTPQRTPLRGLSRANCRGPFQFNPCAKITPSPVLPTAHRADQFRAVSFAVFWVVDLHRRHLSLFPRVHHGHPQTQTPFDSINAAMGSDTAVGSAENRLATGLPSSHSGLEEEGRHAWSERLGRSDTLRVGRRSGAAQLAVTSACHPCVRGVFLKTPLDGHFRSPASRIFPRVSQSVFPHFKPLSSLES